MITRFLSCFFVLLSININAQELPVVVPASPTAFQLTRFGDVPVNESTGKISPSIPLYNYTAGRLQLPISLSYQGNGVKVDQAASWTGINWNLNAGGVITRTVKDGDDFFQTSNRIFYGTDDIAEMDFHYGTTDIDKIKNHINHDSEADIFNFSFANYSGGFYLDENFDAVLTKYDKELKIIVSEPPFDNGIIQNFKREIIITTPDGIEYYFGGLTASEKSKTIYPTAGGGALVASQTAFYLHKIVHPLGDEIYLVYDSFIEYTIKTAVSAVKKKFVSESGGCPSGGGSSGFKEDILSNRIEGGKFLKKIHSNKNNYEIIFTALDRPNTIGANGHYFKRLDNFTVRNSTNLSDEITNINFEYLYPKGITNSQRFFLEKVNLHDGTFYEMDYKHPDELPERFDYDQDLLGYYNNKDNTSFLPKTDNSAFSAENNNLADKTPDFNYSSKGVLEKLTYPTGGYTMFEYESGNLGFTSTTETKYAHFLTYRNDPSRNPTSANPKSVTIGQPTLIGPNSSASTQDHIANQKVDVRLSNVISTEHLDQHVIFELSVLDLTTNTEQYTPPLRKTYEFGTETEINDPNLGTVYSYQPYIFKNITLVSGHEYTFTLNIVANSFQSNATINANIDFNYKIENNELSEDYGIRIKEVKNYTQINNANYELAGKKRYEYLSSNKFIMPRNITKTLNAVPCDGLNSSDYYYTSLHSSSINSIYANSNNEKFYDRVRIYNMDDSNTDIGYTEKEFIIVSDAGSRNGLDETFEYVKGYDIDYYSNAKENKSIVNGTLKKQTNYKRLQGLSNTYIKISELENFYDIDLDTYITNNDYNIVYNNLQINNDYSDLKYIYLGQYNTYSNKILLNTSISKTFDYSKIVDVYTMIPYDPYADPDNDGYPNFIDKDDDGDGTDDVDEVDETQLPEVLETIKHYEFNQYPGQVSKETVITSLEDEAIETIYSYPNTNTDISTYISQPVSIRTSKNIDGVHEQISNVFTGYENAFSNYTGTKQLISKIMTEKGGDYFGTSLPDEDFEISFDLEDRIIYHDYDNNGNPIEISKKDGMHIVYIWGYNGQYPIAKIENATYSQTISSQVANLQSKSNQDVDTCLDSDSCYEQSLRIALKNLRNSLPEAMVTTYTYNPLIGVTSVTDPKGYTMYYEYDDFNRLKQVKDAKGNILSKNEYNYKH